MYYVCMYVCGKVKSIYTSKYIYYGWDTPYMDY